MLPQEMAQTPPPDRVESLDSGGVARGAEPVGVLEMMPSNVKGGCREARECVSGVGTVSGGLLQLAVTWFQNALGLDQAPSQHIPKPWVIPVPKGTLQRIFGTSQVFRNFDDIKPKAAGLTVPLKVREYYHRGHQCLEQEDWEVAVLFFSRGLHLDSQLVEFYALRAEAYIQLCDFSSAAQNLRKAYSSQPENTDYLERLTLVLYLKGQCLFERRAFLDALNVFSQASELQPEKFCFRYRCMACLLALKRHHECLSFVTKEVKHGTTNADVYILRARLYNFFQKFQKAENRFSMAIQHNPQKPQYYLYRARSRQLMQNIFGARQDVATVLLLDPKQPKLLPLMTTLFPGMSVEEVLNSQVAHLARLQLERVVEHSLQAGSPQDILEQPLFETSKELEATRQSLQAKPEGPEEQAKSPGEKEEKLEPGPSKERSLTDSYISQTSSGSILGFRTTSTSETETSTVCQEYGSTSTTVVTFSDSSLLRTQSSDLGDKREDLSLSHSPRKTKSTPGHSQRPSEPEAIQVQSQRPSRTEADQVQSQRPSRTEAIRVQSQRPSRTEAALSQRPSRTKPAQRLRKAKGAHGQSWRPRKAGATQDWSWRLIQSPSNTQTTQGLRQNPSPGS
ncbi:hypothetical protein E2I00_002020 [Balaenoptera physalus]|uniref:Uncharacterized protein n=1 Tax=Balaenoptera physalus TaxID=9770 RepID=A0A6A1QMS9_BALPH|nr:hypothetical protein E2I00_002020 [Balaenoptera physalus]